MSMDCKEKLTSFRPAPPGQDSDASSSVLAEKQANYFAIPRRPATNELYETSANLEHDIRNEAIAYRGFEPDGSATKPSFCEGNSSLLELLSDRQGYGLFREYLRAQKQESLLDFWLSCEEFKMLASAGSSLAAPKANSTFSNYMHSKHLCASILQDVIRLKVKHRLSCGQPLSETLFDNAKEVILCHLNETHYCKFVRSDIYKRSIGGDVLKLSNKDRVSTRNGTRFVGSALPPLPEEKAIEQMSPAWTAYDVNTRSQAGQLEEGRERYVMQDFNLSKAAMASMFCQPAPVVSVNDSDVQSLSSDALTDDSKSTLTDFSDATAKSAEKNGVSGFPDVSGFIPRTKKLPKARKQLPPEEFMKILIEKLEKVVIEREQDERAAINLAGLPQEHIRENKKSILEDAAERHKQYQRTGRLGLGLPPPKFTEACYPMQVPSSTMPTGTMPTYMHPGYIERGVPAGYYPSMEPSDAGSSSWRGCQGEHLVEKSRCPPLGSAKKQWESVGTLESAPDSGVNIEEDAINLPPDARNRILQWMEHSEQEVQQQTRFAKTSRTKQCNVYNSGLQCSLGGNGVMHLQPIAQDPMMPPLAQPDSRNTIEEVKRRLSQKNMREKRTKAHKRPGYISSKSSQRTCPQFSSEADCSSSVVSGDFRPTAIYASSSVLSSVASTMHSSDSGLGCYRKTKQCEEGTKVVYYLDGEKYPYQSVLQGKTVVLKQFKDLVAFKKGNYRYFFKTETDEEDCGAVYEEIRDDNAVLPCYGNKIICKVKAKTV